MAQRKRAQTEIVGLLFIVILLLFAGVLYLRFSLSRQPLPYSSVRESVSEAHFLHALVHYNVEGASFRDLVDVCHLSGDCGRLQSLIQESLSAVFPRHDFTFILLVEDRPLIELTGCHTGIANSYPFTHKSIYYDTQLILCTR